MEAVKRLGIGQVDLCPCRRAEKSVWTWLCTICYLQKEIGYALSELDRDGEWPAHGMERLRKLRDATFTAE